MVSSPGSDIGKSGWVVGASQCGGKSARRNLGCCVGKANSYWSELGANGVRRFAYSFTVYVARRDDRVGISISDKITATSDRWDVSAGPVRGRRCPREFGGREIQLHPGGRLRGIRVDGSRNALATRATNYVKNYAVSASHLHGEELKGPSNLGSWAGSHRIDETFHSRLASGDAESMVKYCHRHRIRVFLHMSQQRWRAWNAF